MFWMRNKENIFLYALLSGGLQVNVHANALAHIHFYIFFARALLIFVLSPFYVLGDDASKGK